MACVESKFKGSDGGLRWVEIHAKALRDPETRQIYYEGSVEDIARVVADGAEVQILPAVAGGR